MEAGQDERSETCRYQLPLTHGHTGTMGHARVVMISIRPQSMPAQGRSEAPLRLPPTVQTLQGSPETIAKDRGQHPN